MRRIHFLLISVLVFTLMACDTNKINPSDTVSSKSYVLTGFDAIDVSTAFEVYVEVGQASEGVLVETNDNVHAHTEVFVEGGTLHIRLKKNTNIQGGLTLRAYVKAGNINGYKISEASRLFLENKLIEQDELQIALSGASNMVAELEVGRLEASLSGASNLDLYGTADRYELAASGASKASGYELLASSVSAGLSGASELKVTAIKDISVSASGASTVYYKGDPEVLSEQLSGASQLIKLE